MSEVIFSAGQNAIGFNFLMNLNLQITDYLEQICYKDLRYETFGSVKVVLFIYKKFLSSCKEQM